MSIITLSQAFEQFEENILPMVIERFGKGDHCAIAEAWNDYTDSLCKDGELNNLQYHYCPSWDEGMPDSDAEFLLDAMGFTLECQNINERPDTSSDTWGEGAKHWQVWVKRGDKMLTTYYSAGSMTNAAMNGSPELADIMYSLLNDASGISYNDTFEEWADEIGYDTDSRKAEKIYNACKEIAKQLEPMFSKDERSDIEEIFSDY